MNTPFVTKIERLTTRPTTHTLPPTSTVTQDGIAIDFHDIQVISRVEEGQVIALVKKYGTNFKKTLVEDRIQENLRLFCANHTINEVYITEFDTIVENVRKEVKASITTLGQDGIELINLVVPKPDIPKDIADNYKRVKVQWTEQLVANQSQITEAIKKRTEVQIQEIENQKSILKKQGEQELSRLENEILKEREQNKVDIDTYKKQKLADANKLLFTPEYMQLEIAKSMSTNTKFYFSGDKGPLGAVFSKVIGGQ